MDVMKEEIFEDPVLKRFNKEIRMNGEKYEIRLPWKEEKKFQLMNNHAIAERRLISLMKQLNKNLELKKRYDKVMREMGKRKLLK